MTGALPATAPPTPREPAALGCVVVGQDGGGDIRMAYAEAGDPAAEVPVLLVHGLFDHKGTWSRLTRHLVAAGCRAVAPDLVGFGDSSKPSFADLNPARRYALDEHVGFLRQFIRRLRLDDLVLVGHSFGGGVALRCLCTPWPDGPRVRGLVLEGAAGFAQAVPAHIRLLAEWPGRLLLSPWVHRLALASGVARRLVGATFLRAFHDPRQIPADLVDQAVHLLRQPDCLYAYRQTARNLVPHDIATFPHRYRDIQVPTLILWGRDDRIVPPLFALRFEAEIPGATLRVFDECGHAPHLECPVEMAALLRDWMRRHGLAEAAT